MSILIIQTGGTIDKIYPKSINGWGFEFGDAAVHRILSKKQLSNLKVFSGNEHNHEAQKPEILDFASLNRKNKFN